MPSETQIPASFSDLSPFVSEWGGLETQDERYHELLLRHFHATAQAWLDDAAPDCSTDDLHAAR
jgi:hypothetical protein